nr:MAG: hypothetical protein [White spot syndrome virus]
MFLLIIMLIILAPLIFVGVNFFVYIKKNNWFSGAISNDTTINPTNSGGVGGLWDNVSDSESGTFPSRVQYSTSTKNLVNIAMDGDYATLVRNGMSTNQRPYETYKDVEDSQFYLHFFHVRNFKPLNGDENKDHLERDESFVLIESPYYNGGFLSYNINNPNPIYNSTEKPYINTEITSIVSTTGTDERFFCLEKEYVEDGEEGVTENRYFLRHMASNYVVKASFKSVMPTIEISDLTGTYNNKNSVKIKPVTGTSIIYEKLQGTK